MLIQDHHCDESIAFIMITIKLRHFDGIAIFVHVTVPSAAPFPMRFGFKITTSLLKHMEHVSTDIQRVIVKQLTV